MRSKGKYLNVGGREGNFVNCFSTWVNNYCLWISLKLPPPPSLPSKVCTIPKRKINKKASGINFTFLLCSYFYFHLFFFSSLLAVISRKKCRNPLTVAAEQLYFFR
uniref:Uncharacterized protein n=1 Tax=Cacopsylla melanoneura TaxID=428564 RepID=A0A8D8ZAC3_9HEMI